MHSGFEKTPPCCRRRRSSIVQPQNAAIHPALLERLQRYLPADLAIAASVAASDDHVAAAISHLTAARATITTYIPRLLTHHLLHDRHSNPWLRPLEGSLLFADLSGSTALAERLSTLGREGIELVTTFLNHIFETMIQVVWSYGGDLITFGGDALLVLFNDTDHARTATNTALALQQVLQ